MTANPLPAQESPSSSFAPRRTKHMHMQRQAARVGEPQCEASLGGTAFQASPLSPPSPTAGASASASADDLDVSAGGAASAWHVNRHSRGRTNVRARLVATTGVPDSDGGLLGRQQAMKVRTATRTTHRHAIERARGGALRTRLPPCRPRRCSRLAVASHAECRRRDAWPRRP